MEPWPAAPLFSPELAPIHRGVEALEQFNRETGLLVLTRAWWCVNPLGMLWPEMDEWYRRLAKHFSEVEVVIWRYR